MERTGPAQGAKPRKELNWWHSFNTWWRDEYDKLGRRPRMQEVDEWYIEHAERTWGADKPSLEATRDHAKCLRSKKELREYFARYNAKKMRGPRHQSGSQQLMSTSPGCASGLVSGGTGTNGPNGGGGGLSAGGTCDGSCGGGGSADTPFTLTSTSMPLPPSAARIDMQLHDNTDDNTRGGLRDPPFRAEDWDRDSGMGGARIGAGVDGPVRYAAAPTGASESVARGSASGVSGAGGEGGGCSQSLGAVSPLGRAPAPPSQHAGGAVATRHAGTELGQQQQPRQQQPQQRHVTDPGVVPRTMVAKSNADSDTSAAPAGAGGATSAAGNAVAAGSHDHNEAQPQPTGPDSGGGGGAAAAAGSAWCSPVVTYASAQPKPPHRISSKMRPPRPSPPPPPAAVEPVVASPRSQSRVHNADNAASGGSGVAVGPGTGPGGAGGGSGSGGKAEAVEGEEAAGGCGATLPMADPFVGNTVMVTRWLADLASTALGHRPGKHPNPGPDGSGDSGGDAAGGAASVRGDRGGDCGSGAAARQWSELQRQRRLVACAAREEVAERNSSAPVAPAARSTPSAPPPMRRHAPEGDPGGAQDDDDAAMDAEGSGTPRLLRTAAAVAAAEPEAARSYPCQADASGGGVAGAAPGGGEAAGYDAHDDDDGDAGRPAAPYDHQRHHRRRINSAGGVDGAQAAGAGPSLTPSSRVRDAGPGTAAPTAAANGGGGGSCSAPPMLRPSDCGDEGSGDGGGPPEPPGLGPQEPSLSALPRPLLAGTASAGARSNGGTFTVEDASAAAGASAGAKRRTAFAPLLRPPSLRAPGAADGADEDPETPSLQRAPKLLRLDQVQHLAAGRMNPAQRPCTASSSGASGVISGPGSAHNLDGGGGSAGGGGGSSAAATATAGAVRAGPLPGVGWGAERGEPGPGPGPGCGTELQSLRGPPPDPFRRPVLVCQRSVGSQGMYGCGFDGGMVAEGSPPLVSTRESVSTRGGGTPLGVPLPPRESVSTRGGGGGMPQPLPATTSAALPPRESVGTAQVPPPLPLLARRDSLETRLMPPPRQQQLLTERSSIILSSGPYNGTATQQQQLAPPLEENHQRQVQHPWREQLHHHHLLIPPGAIQPQGPALPGHAFAPLPTDPVTGTAVREVAAATAAALAVLDRAAAQLPTPTPGAAIVVGGAAARAPPSPPLPVRVPVFLESSDVERVCVRQALDDGHVLEAPLQVVTLRLSLPAVVLDSLRPHAADAAMQPSPPTPSLPS